MSTGSLAGSSHRNIIAGVSMTRLGESGVERNETQGSSIHIKTNALTHSAGVYLGKESHVIKYKTLDVNLVEE